MFSKAIVNKSRKNDKRMHYEEACKALYEIKASQLALSELTKKLDVKLEGMTPDKAVEYYGSQISKLKQLCSSFNSLSMGKNLNEILNSIN